MDKDVKKVIDGLLEDAARIKTNCPIEVLRLYKYQIIPTNMGGLWNQTFTVMVFAEGDMRAMCAYVMMPICRMVDREESTVAQLKMALRETIPISAEFVSTCGLESVWTNVKKVLAVLDLVENKADFKELAEALLAFVNNYHNWIHFYFPWYAGEIFQMRKKEDVAQMAKIFNIG